MGWGEGVVAAFADEALKIVMHGQTRKIGGSVGGLR